MGTGTITCGVVTVVGENGVLCLVNLPGMDQFQVPLVANFHYHRLAAMPFVEWISLTPYGEEEEGLKALTDFISTHHLVPDFDEQEVIPLEKINPNASPQVVETPTLAKRVVSRSSSDESLSKENYNLKNFEISRNSSYIKY